MTTFLKIKYGFAAFATWTGVSYWRVQRSVTTLLRGPNVVAGEMSGDTRGHSIHSQYNIINNTLPYDTLGRL